MKFKLKKKVFVFLASAMQTGSETAGWSRVPEKMLQTACGAGRRMERIVLYHGY